MPIKKIIKKNELDKFYTQKNIAAECIEYLKLYINDKTILIEPSAGNGSFSDLIECIAYDIAPENDRIIKKDFFDVVIKDENICVFGNPPFGNRSNLAKQFISHALNAGIIAFILPEVFMKFTYQQIFPSSWKLVHQNKLENNSFLLENKEYHVPSVFQIWIKDCDKEDLRAKKIIITETNDFSIVGKHDSSGVIFSFGASPSKIIHREAVKESNRGYFLSPKIDKELLITKIKAVNWNNYGKSSVSGGVFWLTKTEYIMSYEDFYNESW